jgi:hypothetical protein
VKKYEKNGATFGVRLVLSYKRLAPMSSKMGAIKGKFGKGLGMLPVAVTAVVTAGRDTSTLRGMDKSFPHK